jgi:hypothetical protein
MLKEKQFVRIAKKVYMEVLSIKLRMIFLAKLKEKECKIHFN